MTVDKDINIQIEVSLPISKKLRALVIVIPGTGGLFDPFFDFELKKEKYDPRSRGGLTSALIDSNYAVAYFRGLILFINFSSCCVRL